MKNKIKILLIAIPVLIVIIVISIISMHKKTINIDEDLITIDCDSGEYYDKTVKEMKKRPIKEEGILKCSVNIKSPKKSKFTYKYVSFDYVIEGNYEYIEKPSSITDDLLQYSDEKVNIVYTKEKTINKKEEYDTIYANLYNFKIKLLNNETNKITFKFNNIRIENNKNIYLLKDYNNSYEIEKNSQ